MTASLLTPCRVFASAKARKFSRRGSARAVSDAVRCHVRNAERCDVGGRYARIGQRRNLGTSLRTAVSNHGPFKKECVMIRVLVLMLSAALLGGCVVVPAGYVTYDDGYYHHHRYYYHSYAYDYRYGHDHGQ
jgi:hypothetical protein